MSRLSAQSIHELCVAEKPLISPYSPEKVVVNGKSAGRSSASYDCCIDHDLELGVNPAFMIADHVMKWGFTQPQLLKEALEANPPMTALAYTQEDFWMPANVSGDVCDKSSYARVFVSAFNTFFDPGFHGNGTLELVNLSDKPVSIKKGDPICQFIFTWLDRPTDRPYDGKYQHQTKGAHPARYELPNGAYMLLEHVGPTGAVDPATLQLIARPE